MRVSIVVPTFNEADNIGPLLKRIKDSLRNYDFEVLIVDDNSPDGTSKVAERTINELNISGKVIVRKSERGLSSAVVRGFAESSGDIVVVMDADLQHPPEVIPKLIGAVESGADVAIASRYIKGGGVENWKWYRKIASRGAIVFAKIFLPQIRGIADPISGFFALKRELIKDKIDSFNPLGFKILLEVLIKAKPERVVEVPFIFQPRKAGSSKLSGKVIVEMMIHALRLSYESGELQRMIKFGVVGLSGVLVNEGVLYLLMESNLTMRKVLAPFIAFEVSVINNFVWNDLWTFKDLRKKSFLERFFGFHAASYIGGAVQLGVYFILYAMGLHYLIANLFAIGFGYVVRYLVNRNAVYI